jgi:plasmid stabilization system protein ParE
VKTVLFSRAAQYDLQDIWIYVADHHPEAADRLEQDIRDEITTLSEMPDLGHRRKDLTKHDLWFHTVRKNYLIVFKRSDPLEIIRILHGARDAVRELE